MYCVYWIKRFTHFDIKTEGYVGITKNFKERMRAHKKLKKLTPLTSAIKSIGWENLDKQILVCCISQEEALKIEAELRPTRNIGWNLLEGGILGVDSSWYDDLENKKQHSINTSIATKIAIQNKDTKSKRSERAKTSRKENKNSYVDLAKGSKNPRAQLNESQVFEIKYRLIPSGLSNKDIAEMFNVKSYVISFIRTGKNWSHV